MNILNNNYTYYFKKRIKEELINNISSLTCSTLGNMLSFDYLDRLKAKPDVTTHITNCNKKIKKKLGKRVITNDDFSVALTLFAIAISPEENLNNLNILEHSEEIIVGNLIANIFGKDNEYNINDKKIIKELFKNILKENKYEELINYIYSNPNLFRANVKYALTKYSTQEEVNKYVKTKTIQILNYDLYLNKKINKFKQVASKLTTTICALGVGALSVVTAGAVFAFAVIPAAIFSIKYAPQIGAKMGQLVMNYDKKIKSELSNLEELKNNSIKESLDFVKEQKKYTSYSITASPSFSQNLINSKKLNQRSK